MSIRSYCMARFYDATMAKTEQATVGAWRSELLADVGGEVLELGPGTGLNLDKYSPEVSRLVLSEPDVNMRRQLAAKLPDYERLGCEIAAHEVETLPFPDASFDCVVETLVLCSVRDPAESLRQVRRVLKPGGRFVFLEHVANEDPRIAKWQRRLEPLWNYCGGNCHLTRRSADMIAASGLDMERCEEGEMLPAPAVVRRTLRGHAVNPG